MKTVDILGANRFDTYTKTRDGSRAVIVQDGKILLTHELNSGWWLIPGGGTEEGETPEDCVIREVEEETGYIVRPVRHFLIMHEYYEEYRYTGYFFVCEVTGKGQMNLTEVEKRRGVQPEWIPLEEALEIFSKHESYADVSEEKRGAYQREYIALCEYMELDPESTEGMEPIPENTESRTGREIFLGGPGTVRIREEHVSAEEYIDFLKRTDLGSQYPKERFNERIAKLVKNVSISLIARNDKGMIVGALFGLTDYCYWLYVTDLGVDRNYERQGIAKTLMKTAHEIAGGEKDIAVYLIANENAVPFYEKLGMKYADDVMQYNHIEWTEWTVE